MSVKRPCSTCFSVLAVLPKAGRLPARLKATASAAAEKTIQCGRFVVGVVLGERSIGHMDPAHDPPR